MSFAYDYNGNTTSKTEGSAVTQYTWDYENRLTQVSLPNDSQGNPQQPVTFKYDPFGRRIQKVSGLGTTDYVYDGANIIGEYNSSSVLVAKYAQGVGIDEPLAMSRQGTTVYYNADGLGSIVSLADGEGTPTNTYTYDAFGKSTNTTGTLFNPFQYTGREWDSETELYYYRARYYDPTIGRFLNEDPKRFDGDGPNFYAYVLNDPINRSDPNGCGFVDCATALARLLASSANFAKDLENIERAVREGRCPDVKHLKELRQRARNLEEQIEKVAKHCGKYIGAAVAVAAGREALKRAAPYLLEGLEGLGEGEGLGWIFAF